VGGSLLVEYAVTPNKITFGVEVGAASGDDAPGFGNVRGGRWPGISPPLRRTPAIRRPTARSRASSGATARRHHQELPLQPAYRVDHVLWRHILGPVTDAIYVKPTLRWDLLPGLRLDAAIVYSRALFSESTPSASEDPAAPGVVVDEGDPNLGIELDTTLTYTSGDGFKAFFEWGALQPLDGSPTTTRSSRAPTSSRSGSRRRSRARRTLARHHRLHVERRLRLDRLLHRALVRDADEGVEVLLGNEGGHLDVELDAREHAGLRVEVVPLPQPDPLGREPALLAEARDVDPRARADGGEEQVEGRRAPSSPPFETGWSVRITCCPIWVSTRLPPGRVTIISLDIRSLSLSCPGWSHGAPRGFRRALPHGNVRAPQ